MISNASSLIVFGRLHRLEVLQKLFGNLDIAEAVHSETIEQGLVLKKPESFLLKEAVDNRFICVEPLNELGKEKYKLLQTMYPRLGAGEAATIALALQKNRKEALIDEGYARKVAEIHGLLPLGIFGVLLLAYEKNILNEPNIRVIVSSIVSGDFRVSAHVIDFFWSLFEEIKKQRRKHES